MYEVKKNPKISTIIPCYCCKDVIGKAVTSLLNQTMAAEDVEIILVNDASPDDSFSFLSDYEKKYPNRITVINCDENRGQAFARNIGIEYARGEYVTFLDQDDWVHPEMYENMYHKAVQYDCDMVCCFHKNVYNYDEQPSMGRCESEEKDALYEIENPAERRTLFLSGISLLGGVDVWEKLFKKEFLVENKIHFPEEKLLYEDYYFMSLVSLYVRKYYILQGYYYYYFVHENGTFLHRDKMYHLDKLKICEKLLEEWKKRGFMQRFSEELEVSFFKNYYLDGLHTIFTKFNDMPVWKVDEMKKTLFGYFPNLLQNAYLHNSVAKESLLSIKGWRKKFFDTLLHETEEKELLELGQSYWEEVKDKYIIIK